MTPNNQGSAGPPPSAKRRRFLLLLVVVFALSGGVVLLHRREVKIEELYAGLPLEFEGNLNSMEARLAALNLLISEYPFSRVGFQADRERHALQLKVDRLETSEARRHIEDSSRLADLEGQAESLRIRGLQCAEQGDMVGAREKFQASLEVDFPEWDKRRTVQADIEAIDAWLALETNE